MLSRCRESMPIGATSPGFRQRKPGTRPSGPKQKAALVGAAFRNVSTGPFDPFRCGAQADRRRRDRSANPPNASNVSVAGSGVESIMKIPESGVMVS